MIVSITRLELVSYSKIKSFFGFNRKIINELQASKCLQFKVKPNWNLRTWYTMTLWECEEDLFEFYRKGTHAHVMREAANFSKNLKATRIEGKTLIPWKDAKKRVQ